MRFLVVFILFFSVGLTNLQADTVDWKGITWYVGGLAVGRVEVDPVTDYLQIFFPDLLIPNAGVSYLTTPEFQAAPGSWVEAKFLDSLGTNPTPRIEVQSQWLGMILFASFDMFGEYYTFNWSQVLWDLTSLGRGGISLKRRSLGEHTVKIAKRINSVVEFWLDGDLVYNFTPPITPVPGFYSVGLQAFNRGRQTEAIATFTDYRAGIERPVCDVKSIRVDRSLSNGVIDAEVSGEPCEATITLKNLKNFWTNFTIGTAGRVTVTPVGGDLNLYARYHLLPPSSFFPLPSEGATSYTVRFSRPGEAVSVFADPTVESGYAAGMMNILQAILNVLPLGGTPRLVIEDHQRIVAAFPQMPHLQNAVTILFEDRPNIIAVLAELLEFLLSEAERNVFVNLMSDLKISISSEVFSSVLGYPLDIILSLATIFVELKTAFFEYPAGSIRLIAE